MQIVLCALSVILIASPDSTYNCPAEQDTESALEPFERCDGRVLKHHFNSDMESSSRSEQLMQTAFVKFVLKYIANCQLFDVLRL